MGNSRRRTPTSSPANDPAAYYRLTTTGKQPDKCTLEISYDDKTLLRGDWVEFKRDQYQKGFWPRDNWEGDKLKTQHKSMMAAVGLAKLLKGGHVESQTGNAKVNFRNVWDAIVKATFDAPSTKKMLFIPGSADQALTYFKDRSSGFPGGDKQMKCMMSINNKEPQGYQPMMGSTLGKAYIRGLTLLVHGRSKMTVEWRPDENSSNTKAVLRASLEWNFKVCPGCDCELPGKKRGLVYAKIKHTILENGAGRQGLIFFAAFDKAFREYIANIRALVIAKKVTCCTAHDQTIEKLAMGLRHRQADVRSGEIGQHPACWAGSGIVGVARHDPHQFTASTKDGVGT